MKLAHSLLPLVLLAVPAANAEAQLVYVTGQRNLASGGMMRSIPRHVPPVDAVHGGQFEFRGTLNNAVRITFTLLTRLNTVSVTMRAQ